MSNDLPRHGGRILVDKKARPTARSRSGRPQQPSNTLAAASPLVVSQASFCGQLPVCLSSLAQFRFDATNNNNNNKNSQKCDTAGAEGVDPSAVLEIAAPDICNEEAFFAPRSKAQEDANVGTFEERARAAGKPPLPAGAWLEAAKELVPPPPPPEVQKQHNIHVRWPMARCAPL